MIVTDRVRVLQLYRRILKIGKSWEALEPAQTNYERAGILLEARLSFRENKELSDAREISKLIIRAEQRIELAQHYGIPYKRPEYLPPDTAFNVKLSAKKFQQLSRLRKTAQ
ncbi:unnamed protein product [Caenorhabditis auriculariae]|uniref:Complex 1 LYR protein domain-containing protein n=1 Tax=Caenorhabditis auriculariae TaxID=2777116 RepID=A0A8S1HUB2_9PELO|nr:unnamed protein product [Caenorhabditis auriculariae]